MRQDASPAVKATVAGDTGAQTTLRVIDGRFVDYRWVAGRWVLPEFASAGGVMDYSAWEKVGAAAPSHRCTAVTGCAAYDCMGLLWRSLRAKVRGECLCLPVEVD